MADLYHSQFLPEEELKVQKMCENIAWKDKDTLSALKAYELRLRPYNLLDNQDSILSITKNARNKYLKYNRVKEAAQVLCTAIGILLNRNELDSVSTYMDIFERESGLWDNDSVVSQNVKLYYHIKGRACLLQDQVDSAKFYFNELQRAGGKEAAYNGLLLYYEKINKQDSIAKYSKLFAEANDSSYVGMNSEIVAQMSAMYNYGRHEKIAKDKTLESANAKMMTFLITAIAIVGFMILMTAIAIMRRRSKERERIHKEQEKLLLKRYNETKEVISKLEEEKKALVSDNANIDQLLQTISKFENEKLELETKLKEFNQITDDVDFKAWYESFIDCNAANKLHAKTIISPNSVVKIEDELWEELKKHIKRSCPEFLTILDAYSLNPTYEKIVLLNTFDFSNGEISILFDKTSQQISNIHNRLSKKMFPSSNDTRKLKQNIQEILRDKRV